jgi:membrane protein insertase Oxa1/YidC/SpoIIIJ
MVLSMFIQHGWAIILFTILVKLVLSPITYKSFCLRQNESIELKLMNWGEIQKD